jgi:hypothetical protein
MPRFLAPQGRSGDGHGYMREPLRPLQPGDNEQTVARIRDATSMCDEPQSLDAQEWLNHIDERHKTLEEQRRKFEAVRIDQERRLMSFEQRLDHGPQGGQAPLHRCVQ